MQVDALVEKRLGAGEDHGAIYIVLGLHIGEIADAHRLVPPIAAQAFDRGLRQRRLHLHAEHRLEAAVGAGGDDIENVAEELLHGARRAEAVERADGEIGVAQPAEAVVPIALRARRFRHRSGDGGDDGAAVLDRAELERDRRAYDGVLPLERHRQVARPLAPVIVRPLLEFARDLMHRTRQRLVLRQDEIDGLVQEERRLVEHVGDRHFRRQAQHMVRQDVADMVAAARDFRGLGAVIAGWAQPYADTRRASQTANAANQAQRPEQPPELLEAGRKVQDLDRGPVLREQAGFHDGRVGPVSLFAAQEAFDLDLVEADILLRLQQVAEYRVAVEARHARPDDAPARVEQRGIAAVADHA